MRSSMLEIAIIVSMPKTVEKDKTLRTLFS